jgi:signal transduction histidine kinase
MRGLGAGFLNMADRLGALGGSLRVESAPWRGTTVSGTIPVSALRVTGTFAEPPSPGG